MYNNISKVIMPVAGLGTRSLPASKTIPKEMLPIFDKPIIHYIVEEALEANLKDVVFITSKNKTSLEDYFDDDFQLEMNLEQKGKIDLLTKVKQVAQMIEITTVRQKQQLGLGHAVLCAEKFIHDEAFGVMVGDDIFVSEVSGMKQLIDIAKQEKMPVIGVMEVAPDQVNRYGIIDGIKRSDGLYEINNMVEKPAIDKAPSNLAIIGRYVLTPEIFHYLHNTQKGYGGEIQLTDAMQSYLKKHKMLAVPIKGVRYDAGDWVDFFAAGIYFALKDEKIKPALVEKIKNLIGTC